MNEDNNMTSEIDKKSDIGVNENPPKTSTRPNRDEHGHEPRRGLISRSICKKISYVTQFLVICFALSAFCISVYYSIIKLLSRQILEGKETESYKQTWFKFAICLRPFMTSSLLKEVYFMNVRRSFESFLKTKEMRHEWTGDFMLDDTLRKTEYKDYFRSVHPWNDVRMPVSVLWKRQMNTTLEAFQEFKVNKKGLPTTATRASDDALEDNRHVYTVLPDPGDKLDGEGSMLLGYYSMSPLYAGCVNITVNRTMAQRQMEIRVKFGNTRQTFVKHRKTDRETYTGSSKVDMFLAADLFVYHTRETFTELPVVKRLAKFSIQANSLERLLVKGESYTKAKSGELECNDDSGYSQTNCRYWCIMRAFVDKTPCALPWMENILSKPWMATKKKKLKNCQNSKQFLNALDLQHKYLGETNETEEVRQCLNIDCPDPCTTYKVQLLSLGSKSIGSNYGISLTISPEFDKVTESFDYTVLNMVAELSASISFLLGLSAIAIYDWLIAFGLWLAMRLGLHRCCCGELDEAADRLEGDGGGGYEGAVKLSQSAALRLEVLHEVERQRELQETSYDTDASMIWHVEPAAGSLPLPRRRSGGEKSPEAEEQFATPAARSPETGGEGTPV